MTQLPVLIVLIPFFSSLIVALLGFFRPKTTYFLTVISLLATFLATLLAAFSVHNSGTLTYVLGNWPAPFGIEYVIDPLNALVLILVSLVSFLTAIYSYPTASTAFKDRLGQFYTLFLLLTTGLLGMTVTGDVFNLYVLLEISALSSYALIALNRGRAYLSTFYYLIIGSIGASFYLLGVGHLLLKTGTLNMADLASILPSLSSSQAVWLGCLFILLGLWVKMAFFPSHGWLPNAYSHAPIASACLMAPLMTKVSVYIMVRLILTVFGPGYIFTTLTLKPLILFVSILAIVTGSLFALTQKHLKKMLTYLIIAEIGYMVGGIWLANASGLTGAIFHIFADGLMTACLFMAAGSFIYRTGNDAIHSLKGMFSAQPLTSAAFLVGAFSMIGIPPTAGFFSKWYLLSGAVESGAWGFFAALLFSSLVNAILFFRIIEAGFFGDKNSTNDTNPAFEKKESPLLMTLPLVCSAILIILLGLFSDFIVTEFISDMIPKAF